MSSRRRKNFRKLNSPALSLWSACLYCLLKQLVDVSFSQGSVFPQTFFSNLVYLFFSFLSKGFWVWQRLTIFRYTWVHFSTYSTGTLFFSKQNDCDVGDVETGDWREKDAQYILKFESSNCKWTVHWNRFRNIFDLHFNSFFLKSLWCTFKKVLIYLLAFE